MNTTQPSSLREKLLRGGAVIVLSLAVAYVIFFNCRSGAGPVQDALRACATIAFILTLTGAGVVRIRGIPPATIWNRWGFAASAFGVALFLAVVVFVAQSVVLGFRAVYLALDVYRGYPSANEICFGYGAPGLWSLALITLATLVALLALRERHLFSCLTWSCMLAATWACMIPGEFRALPTGGYTRTGWASLLLFSWSAIPLGVYLLIHELKPVRPSGLKATPQDGADSPKEPQRGPSAVIPPGMVTSYECIAVLVALLACYHLAVPVRLPFGGFRSGTLLVALSTGLLSLACSLMLRCEWRRALADASMGLATLSLCSLATLAVPPSATVLAVRYPMLFNAMIVGFGCASGIWAYVTCCCRDVDRGHQVFSIPLRALAPHARRASFVAAAMALLSGVTMALWPRFPAIATMDDSIGRMTAGIAGNLFLLLVMLWSSRRLKSSAYHILTVITVISTAAFIVGRMIPFASQVN